MGSLRLILGLAAALAVASFGVINMEPVSVAYYRGTIRLPLFYILLGVFGAGFLLAWAGGVFDRLRFNRQIRRLRREVRTIESDLARAREQSGRLLAAGNPEEPPRPLPAGATSSDEPSPGAPPAPGPPQQEGKDAAPR